MSSNQDNSADSQSADEVLPNDPLTQEIDEHINKFVSQTHFLKINRLIEISNGFIALVGDNKIGIYTRDSTGANYQLTCAGFLNSDEINTSKS